MFLNDGAVIPKISHSRLSNMRLRMRGASSSICIEVVITVGDSAL